MGKKSKTGFFLGILSFAFLGFAFEVNAQEDVKLRGWAWSSNIGWISFSSRDCDIDGDGMYEGSGETGGAAPTGCPTSGTAKPYGVIADDATGALSGYAWSPGIGWIKFNPSGTAPSPRYPTSGPLGEAPDTVEKAAHIDLTADDTGPCEDTTKQYQLCGWARVCSVIDDDDGDGIPNEPEDMDCEGPLKDVSETGGWDGWVSLRGFVQETGIISFRDNFEVGTIDCDGEGAGTQLLGKWTKCRDASNKSLKTYAAAAHEGTQGIRFLWDTEGSGPTPGEYLQKQIPSIEQIYVRFWLKPVEVGTNSSNYHTFSSVSDTDARGSGIASLSMQKASSVSPIRFYTHLIDGTSPQEANPSFTFDPTKWYCVEYHVVPDDTAGILDARISDESGNQLVSVSRTGNTGADLIGWLRLGWEKGRNDAELYYDDYAASSEDWLGCGALAPLEDASLVAYWKFDEPPHDDDSLVIDSSGNGNDAIFPPFPDQNTNDNVCDSGTNWVPDQWATDPFLRDPDTGNCIGPKPGAPWALLFLQNDLMKANIVPAIDNDPRTITAWIKIPNTITTPPTKTGRIFEYGTAGVGSQFQFLVENFCPPSPWPCGEYIVFYFDGSNKIVFSSSDTIEKPFEKNKWYHISVVVPDTAVSINHVQMYVGIEGGTSSVKVKQTTSFAIQPLQTSSSVFLVGGLTPDSGAGVTIDEMRLYSRALSPAEIQKVFQNGGFRPFGVLWDKVSGELQSWAWGGSGIGWINFSHMEWCDTPSRDNASNGSEGCPSATDEIIPGIVFPDYPNARVIFNQKPDTPSSLVADPPPLGGSCTQSAHMELRWTFSDPDVEDAQGAYQVIINENLTTLHTSPFVNSCPGNTSAPNFTPPPNEHPPLDNTAATETCRVPPVWSASTYQASGLAFDTAYYWKVRVRDNHGLLSQWSLWPFQAQFTTNEKPPIVDFDFIPKNPTQDEVVTFEDKSDCGGGPDSCDSISTNRYEWDFDYNGTYVPFPTIPGIDCDSNADSQCRTGPVTHTYPAPLAGNRVYLRITDTSLTPPDYCDEEKPLDIFLPFPGWKEISPF